MKHVFKKIGSVLASTAMLCSTVALAAAAKFPAPYVSGSGADVAIVHGGAKAAYTDIVAVADISSYLSTKLASQTATGTGTAAEANVDGEAVSLFTGSSPLFMNSTVNNVIETITETDLPTVLADGAFEGASTINYKQRVLMGSNSITFAQMPSNDDDPTIGISLSTTPSTNPLYNATVTFEDNANFTHADSTGEELVLFGQKYTVGSATTATKLVLFKSSKTINLDSDANPTGTVEVDGNEYTITLVAASDTSATIKVTDADGNSDQKEISEAASKKIRGLEVAVETADENNFRLTATVSVGSNRISLEDGSAVKVGTDEDLIDGTNVEFETKAGAATSYTGEIGKIIFQAAASDSDVDAVFPGGSYVDPVFGTFKVDFVELSIPIDSAAREDIKITPNGNDKMTVTFKSHESTESAGVDWVYNRTDSESGGQDVADDEGAPFTLNEMGAVNRSHYVLLANKDEGGLYQVTQLVNSSSTSPSDDKITLKNMFTGKSSTFTADTEGQGSFTLQGKSFTFTYQGASTLAAEARTVRFSYPESSGQNVILYPTIRTSKGAKVAFYEPLTLDLQNWDGGSSTASGLMFPNGDGYTTATLVTNLDGINVLWNVTSGDTTTSLNTSNAGSASLTVGQLTYNMTFDGTDGSNATTIYLVSPEGGNIARPALVVFEEKDDNNAYHALVVTTDSGYDGDSAGIGVGDIIRTWGADTQLGNEIRLETNTDMYQDMDWWGTLAEVDKGDSDQIEGRISYPDNQVTALVYIGEVDASITSGAVSSGGATVKSLGNVAIADSEVGSASTKNLIVVGGSCVNSVAAELLGVANPTCGADFTTKTAVGSGEYLIETFARSGGKVATLVAGYNAGDTTNAAKALTTQDIDTTVGKKYKGTSATSIQAVVDSA